MTDHDGISQPETAPPLYGGPTAADLARIPAVLTRRPQWVLFRLRDRVDKITGARTGLDKIPYTIHLASASSTDETTWSPFPACVHALPTALEEWQTADPAAYRGGGLGYVFTAEDPFSGVDLDHCRDPATGAVEPWAQTIVETLASYTQCSVSGTGLHCIVTGRLPGGKRQQGDLQMWDQARFFAMTGWHVPGTPRTIEPRQAALTLVWHAHLGQGRPDADPPAAVPPVSPRLSDTVLLEKARGAANSVKFQDLWGGHWQGYAYDSPSEADLALCEQLAFWTQDPEQIARLFADSGLYRKDKWGNRPDYRRRTIQAALAHCETFYQPETWLDDQIRLAHPERSSNGSAPPTGRPGDPPAAPPAWMKTLNTTKGGEPKETFNNLVLALEHLDPWRTQSWYDLVRDRGMIGTQPLDDAQVWQAARGIEQAIRLPIRNLKLITSALRSHCLQTPRDVLQEWLGALAPWDGTERLTEWLADHAGVPKTAYTMAVGRLFLVSMVARALHPGIQCRSVIIFEGEEEIGKSELVKTLAGEAWYREVSGTLEGKEAHMLMKGVWIVELSEMDVLLRTEESRVKSFITMCNDDYVPKYANDPVKLARRTILVGTINPEGDGSYLRGQTGNTRYYPVRVGPVALADVAASREQLFAEALHWFHAHPADWWKMPDAAAAELVLIRETRRKEGVFEGPRLQAWLHRVRAGDAAVLAPFHTEDALRDCFNIGPERWTAAMKDQMWKAIGKLGWESKASRARGAVQRLWHPKAVTPDEEV
jgi:putative DNA primase/helicase